MSTIGARIRFALDHRWAPPRMSQYLDRELDAGGQARIARHVQDCPECRELLRSLGALVTALGTMRGEHSEPVAATLLEGIQERLRDGT